MKYRSKHLISGKFKTVENTCFKNIKYILFRKYCIFAMFVFISTFVSAKDITSGAHLQFAVEQGAMVDNNLASIKNIAWQIINVALFVGLIPVIRALSDGGEKGRKMLIGWVIALIVFQVAFTIV